MKLRFTIRDLLWLAALAAICLAWLIDRTRVASQRDQAVTQSDEWESHAGHTMERLDYIRDIKTALQKRMLKLAEKQNNKEIEDEIKRFNKEVADN